MGEKGSPKEEAKMTANPNRRGEFWYDRESKSLRRRGEKFPPIQRKGRLLPPVATTICKEYRVVGRDPWKGMRRSNPPDWLLGR